MIVGLLKTVRVERNREASDSVGEQITKHGLRISFLAVEQVYRPHRVAGSRPEADEVHRAHVELRLLLGRGIVGTTRVLRPAVDALLHFLRNRHKARGTSLKDPR